MFSSRMSTPPVQDALFKKFADDLTLSNTYPHDEPTENIIEDLQIMQECIHAWGRDNRVEFDPGKEEFGIIHHINGVGDDFRLLGPIIDCKLSMRTAINKIVQKAHPTLDS